MLDVLGLILISAGALGLGASYLEKEKQQIEELRQLSYLFRLLKSEIGFKKQSLPHACQEAGRKTKGGKGRVLQQIADWMEKGSGKHFSQLWREEWQSYLQTSPLSKEEKQKVIDFSLFVGYEEESMQEAMMEQQVEEFGRLSEEKRQEWEKKKRVVLQCSLCMGILFALILL